MANYTGHLLGGFIVGGLSLFGLSHFKVYKLNIHNSVLLMAAVMLGALFPDVDTHSKSRRVIYTLFITIDLSLMIAKLYKWAAILGFCAMLPALGQHRGWTHTWWAMLLVPSVILFVAMLLYNQTVMEILPYYLAMVAGYFSHLLLDRKF
jgi:membrane-bound metal-dependent hydrolase YbcI (DUF457 family)